MKYILILILSALSNVLLCQKPVTISGDEADSSNIVSFTIEFKKEYATKDGYYLSGYVVLIDDAVAEKLDGKKIKITGVYHITERLKDELIEYDENGAIIYEQGRLNDAKHILSPDIEIIEEQ